MSRMAHHGRFCDFHLILVINARTLTVHSRI
jgi:hypothetical protein